MNTHAILNINHLFPNIFRSILACISLLPFSLFSQTTVTIGSGTTDSHFQPVNNWYGYGRAAMIYTSAEIGATGVDITSIQFQVASSQATAIPLKIYMKTTSSTEPASATWAATISGATLVYDDNYAFSATGWMTIDITDFSYTGDNLMILTEGNYGGGGVGSNPYFETTTGSTGWRSWFQDDSEPLDNGSTSATHGYRANVKITYQSSCSAPSTQATNFSSSLLASTTMTVGWTRGDGDAGVVVVAKASGAVTVDPTSGVLPTGNAAFGSGTDLGSGNYVVYVGTGTSVNLTALSTSTTYHFAVYEYNSSGTCYHLTQLTGNASTTACSSPSTQATGFSSSSIASTTMTIGWSRGNGDAGVVVVARESGAVDADVTSGTSYTADAAFGSGTQVGTGNYVVYKGTGTSVNLTALTAGTTYYFAVYEYNASGTCFNLTELTGNATTTGPVIIGTGTVDGLNYPFYNYYENNKTQILYLQSEIGVAKTITSIAFDIKYVCSDVTRRDMTDFTVKFLHTSTASMSAAYENTASAVTVFSDVSYDLPSATGYFQIDIDDFAYNGTDNLLIEIYWGDNGEYAAVGDDYSVNCTTNASYMVTYGYEDTETPPTYDGRSKDRPNIKFYSASSEQTWIGGVSTDWSNVANWSEAVPTTTMSAIIPSGTTFAPTIGVSVDADCLNLTIASGATLTVAAVDYALHIYGNLSNEGTISHTGTKYIYLDGTSHTLSGSGVFSTNAIYVNNGANYTLGDNITIAQLKVYDNATSSLSLDSYTLTVTGWLQQYGVIDLGTGVLEYQGTAAHHYHTDSRLTENTGTFYYNGVSASQTVQTGTYYDLKIGTISGNTCTIGSTAATTVSHDLTIINPSTAGGIASAAYDISVGNDLAIANSGNALTFAIGTATVTTTGATTIASAVTLSTGTLDANGSFNATGGTITFSDAGNLNLGGAVTSLGTFTAYNSTVSYDAAGAQNVDDVNYFNLTIDGSGTKTLQGNIDIGGDVGDVSIDGEGLLTVDTGCTFAIGDHTITHLELDDFGTDNNTIAGTVTLNNGDWTVTYGEDANLTTSGTITVTGTGIIRLRGGRGHTLGTFTPGSGTVYYSRNGAQTIQAQTFNNLIIDGSSTKTLGGAIDVNGNLTISAGTLASASTYDITVAGNWTNNGTAFTHASNLVSFDGGSAQTIGGSTVTNFYDATIANSSGGVALGVNTTVEGTLTLSSGKLTVQDYTLTMGTTSVNGTISGGGGTNYIVAHDEGDGTVGYVKHNVNGNATYSFPIGDATHYTPLSFTLSSGTLSTADMTVHTNATVIPDLNSSTVNYIDRYWDIDPTGISDATYDVSYTYHDDDIVGVETNFLPVKFTDGTTWYKPTGSSFTDGTAQGSSVGTDVGANLMVWTGLSTFSLLGGVGNGAIPLPVQLTNFSGQKQGRSNELFWTTQSEQNNDFFTVEKTTDGSNYDIVGNLNGAGNSNVVLNYSLLDNNITPVINYYRLKQTDFDGKCTYSKIISIDNREGVSSSTKEVSMRTNLLGQEVNEYYRGVVIIVYSDGSSVKVIQ